jgi:antiviral helicase SKI2
MKVDVHSIVDRHMIASMNEVISNLAGLSLEWASTGTIPEVEWLKMRSLDFQETLRSRDRLVQRLSTVACTMCADFEDHVSFFFLTGGVSSMLIPLAQYATLHTEKILRSNVANLKMAISDQNLELIPDYEQRIEVLQDLQFIDDNSTVLLKGRVACEVRTKLVLAWLGCIDRALTFTRIDQFCQRAGSDRAHP